MANQDRVNFVWAESALTTIPPIPVSEVAYRDTTQTPEQMEVGQQYDTIYNSARHNQLLFLLTSVAKTLCENGIMPFLAGQEYSQYARCIFTDGKLYTASRAILANEQPYPTPGDDSGVWIAEETNENLVPDSRRVIAGSGLTGGGTLSEDITLAVLTDKVTAAVKKGAITVKDVAIGGAASDLASKRGQIGNSKATNSHDFSSGMLSEKPGMYTAMNSGSTNVPFTGPFAEMILGSPTYRGSLLITSGRSTFPRAAVSAINTEQGFSGYNRLITEQQIGDGITVNNGIISVPEYVGATASAPGTSGLVPPAAARERESFLTGSGKYKPALSTSGGTITGELNIAAPAGGSEGGEITLINGTDGKYPAKIDTTRNLIRFFGGPSNPVSVDLETGRFVGNLTGKADTAGIADNSLAFANGRRWVEVIYEGNPGWLIGSVKEELRPVSPSGLNVNYANSAGTANGLGDYPFSDSTYGAVNYLLGIVNNKIYKIEPDTFFNSISSYSVVGSNSYCVFPNGMCVEWGGCSASTTVTYPKAFTNTPYIVATGIASGANISIGSSTTTSFKLSTDTYGESIGGGKDSCHWIAIGYVKV